MKKNHKYFTRRPGPPNHDILRSARQPFTNGTPLPDTWPSDIPHLSSPYFSTLMSQCRQRSYCDYVCVAWWITMVKLKGHILKSFSKIFFSILWFVSYSTKFMSLCIVGKKLTALHCLMYLLLRKRCFDVPIHPEHDTLRSPLVLTKK